MAPPLFGRASIYPGDQFALRGAPGSVSTFRNKPTPQRLKARVQYREQAGSIVPTPTLASEDFLLWSASHAGVQRALAVSSI
jgi:hypothetical protein